MATNDQQPDHENAESRRQERRAQGNQDYHDTPESRIQPDRNDPRGHHDRTRDGDGNQDFSTIGDDGTSDGVATIVTGSGANNNGPGGNIGDKTDSPSDMGTKGGGSSKQPHLNTPSAQSSHQAGGPRGDHGQSGHKGSRSGNQE
jgi:hypothetical protein